MKGLNIVGTSSGELVAKYGSRQPIASSTKEQDNKNTNTIPKEIKYAPNEFKRLMGYEEPDYLQVAGLYASIESSKHSKVYGGFLVKRADYVAKALDWRTEDGTLDVKRAERAIRTACRTKSPNGLYYMYTESNKNCRLSDKGGGRLYMSGKRYQELQHEHSELGAEQEELKTIQEQSSDDIVRNMILKTAVRNGLKSFGEGAVVYVKKHLCSKLPMDEIEYYLDQLASDTYRYHALNRKNCPKINSIFDIYFKYDRIIRYIDAHSEPESE